MNNKSANFLFVDGHAEPRQLKKATPPGVLVPQSASGPDALTRFDSCDELLEWYVARNLPDVGPYGWENEFTGYTVAVANSKAYGGGMFVAPDAEIDDGRFDVVMIGTILDELERTNGRYGLVTMCAAGGMAPAIIIERV